MATRRALTRRRTEAGPALSDETWSFFSWTEEQLAERYGSLRAAKERHDYLVLTGQLRACWRPGGVPMIDGSALVLKETEESYER